MFRTKTCGELRATDQGKEVTLSGWVDSYRDHSGVLFVDLRDRYGKTQVVFSSKMGEKEFELAKSFRMEDVIQVTGVVNLRPEGTNNPKIGTGEIELRATQVVLLNKSDVLPFLPTGFDIPAEEMRLKYRYLDLRRPEMQRTLMLRHKITKVMRDYFDENNFAEIETPMLGKSTPEGARDYLVPSRVSQGSFYALPQSPQLYKQILMISGMDRYVQIARCFRDEDLRADRQPEFTQLDVEMSFVNMDDIMGMIDGLIARLCKDIRGEELKLPLPRMTYHEAMERFGHDAPDLRFGMELMDVTELAKECEYRVFREPAIGGGRVRGINVKGEAERYSRKDIDELTEFAKEFGAKGLVWFKVDADGKLSSPMAKNFNDALLQKIGAKLQAEPNDILFFCCDSFEITCRVLNVLRRRFAAELKLYDPAKLNISWVTKFPMFARDDETGGWTAMHHPFTAPLVEDLPLLKTNPEKVRAQAYDLVINGFEAGGGTIRIHDTHLQSDVFTLIGLSLETARTQFGFLLDALKLGAPPHGGIALGLDRVVMLFAGLDNIRDCIAFPKTAKAACLMTGAPDIVAKKQLDDLAIRCTVAPKDAKSS
ncbi:MAG: aspartate--tRNA ligase [Planctomycetaceae bacterium]|nr:aspartate--tRNA ligase [Planctomycetaceae bacterium]